jgi:DNA-directed RNA polymerase specialized sigma24 family protein
MEIKERSEAVNAALQALYEQYANRTLRLASQFVGHDQAWDASQEFWVSLLEGNQRETNLIEDARRFFNNKKRKAQIADRVLPHISLETLDRNNLPIIDPNSFTEEYFFAEVE